MSDLKPVTLYCCKGCQHLHHEIVTACDCGTGCDPFEYELWEARHTQPEAAPAQDLSAAILALPCKMPDYRDYAMGSSERGPHRDGYRAGHRAALKAAAALASSANALSAGDRVDAERWRFRQEFLETGGAVIFSGGYCTLRYPGCDALAVGKTEMEAIDAAILQSQKGGSHG